MKIDANILKINQLVEIYLTRSLRGNHYRSRIEEITPGQLVLAMPFDKGMPVLLPFGAKVYGKIVTEAVPYLFAVSFIDKKMNPLPVWLVTLPTELTQIQQREFVRLDIKLSATISFVDDKEKSPVKLIINDISGGGLRLVASYSYPIGKKIMLTFELPEHETIEILGEIVRHEQPQSDRTVYWLGVKYIGITERQRNKIIKYIFQKQLERHRRGF